ncbi:hypothetical protein K440DRAFT_637854 [Wilcoxina mikolae CBS 423.85]|nr:hypothetical protein K440DRAFT_637854 [Wilcoxina mikolae CBS 423.85]
MIDAHLSESLEQSEKFPKICDLNECLAANVRDLEATELGQDTNNELAAAHQEIDELEEELQIKKSRSAKLKRRLEKCKSDPESRENTTVAQLRLEKDMLLHQVKSLSSEKSELKSELRALERII